MLNEVVYPKYNPLLYLIYTLQSIRDNDELQTNSYLYSIYKPKSLLKIHKTDKKGASWNA